MNSHPSSLKRAAANQDIPALVEWMPRANPHEALQVLEYACNNDMSVDVIDAMVRHLPTFKSTQENATNDLVLSFNKILFRAWIQQKHEMMWTMVKGVNQSQYVSGLDRLACEMISANNTLNFQQLLDKVNDHNILNWERFLQAASSSAVSTETFQYVLERSNIVNDQQAERVAYWFITNNRPEELDMLRQHLGMTQVSNNLVATAASCGHLHLVHDLLPDSDWSRGHNDDLVSSLFETLHKGHHPCFDAVKEHISTALYQAIFYKALDMNSAGALQATLEHIPAPPLSEKNLDQYTNRKSSSQATMRIVSKCLAAQPKETWMMALANKAAHNEGTGLLLAILEAHPPTFEETDALLATMKSMKAGCDQEMVEILAPWVTSTHVTTHIKGMKKGSPLYAFLSSLQLKDVLSVHLEGHSSNKPSRKM